MNPGDLNLAGLCNCKLFSSPRAIPVSLMNLRPDQSWWGLKPISQSQGSLGTRFMTHCHSVSCLGIHYWHLLAFALQMSRIFFFSRFFSLFLSDFLASAQPCGNSSVLLVSAPILCHHQSKWFVSLLQPQPSTACSEPHSATRNRKTGGNTGIYFDLNPYF